MLGGYQRPKSSILKETILKDPTTTLSARFVFCQTACTQCTHPKSGLLHAASLRKAAGCCTAEGVNTTHAYTLSAAVWRRDTVLASGLTDCQRVFR